MSPVPRGSPIAAITRGTLVVACLIATAATVPAVTITSTLRVRSSATSTGNRSYFPSAHRYSMTTFQPST